MQYGVDVHTTKEWLHWQGFEFKRIKFFFFLEGDSHWCRKQYFYSLSNKIKNKRLPSDAINSVQILLLGDFRNPLCNKNSELYLNGKFVVRLERARLKSRNVKYFNIVYNILIDVRVYTFNTLHNILSDFFLA